MISEDCGVHPRFGWRIRYQSAEAFTYTYCWAGLKEKRLYSPVFVLLLLADGLF